jgi:outer membrane protein TolC
VKPPPHGKALGLVAAATLLVPAWSAAETLQQAWQLAMQHDNGLAAASADADSARASERAARAARWPSLSANAAYTGFSTAPEFQFAAGGVTLQAPIFSGDDYASSTIQMKLPLYTGGRITAGIGAAEKAALGASEAERVALASLRLEVAESYVDVLRAKRLERTAESSVASLRAHAGDVESLVERELVARSDLLAARVALANAEQQRVRADNATAVAYAAYNRRLGEALDRTPQLEEPIPADPALAAEPLEALLSRARESRSELSALAARAEALALQARVERADLLPQLALTGGYTYLENEFLDRKDFSSVGVGVTWSLFDGGQARNRSAALRSASRAAARRVDDLRTQIELQVREAWLNLREAGARVKASAEAVAQAEENLRITRELYGTGLGTNTEVLDAIALQVSATNNRDNAVLDESLARLRLARAVGSL